MKCIFWAYIAGTLFLMLFFWGGYQIGKIEGAKQSQHVTSKGDK